MTRGTDHGMLTGDEVAGGSSPVTQGMLVRSVTREPPLELLARAQRGDADAFDALARGRIDRAYRLALSILRSEPDAHDAVQEAFVSAWRDLPRLRDPDRFDAWLDRIVVNACRMALRHRRIVRIHEIDATGATAARGGADGGLGGSADDPHGSRAAWDGGRSAEPGPDEVVADAAMVRAALLRLDADRRALLVLHHVEGRPVAEIATVLGIPTGTVKWRLHAARAALQRALEEEDR